MFKFYGPKRRRRFDEDADWVPPKNRPFVMKQPKAETEPKSESLPPQDSKRTKKTTDKEGLDKAYASDNGLCRDPTGTLHVAGTRGGFLGSDWMENYRVYGPGLVSKLGNMYGKLDSGRFVWKDWYSTGQIFLT